MTFLHSLKAFTIASVLLVAPFMTPALSGQSTFGTILGTVKDPAGGVIVGVSVTVTNEGTNIAKATITDSSGNYEVSHLNPGPYTIVAESAGFQKYIHRGINLETGQVLRIDVHLVVGQGGTCPRRFRRVNCRTRVCEINSAVSEICPWSTRTQYRRGW